MYILLFVSFLVILLVVFFIHHNNETKINEDKLNIALVIHTEDDSDYIDELVKKSNHQYTKYMLNRQEDSNEIYKNILNKKYDLIIGGRYTYEVEEWIKAKSKIPFISISSTGILDIHNPNLLYRLCPTDDRNIPAHLSRLSFTENITMKEVYSKTGIIVKKGEKYSESFVKIFIDNAIASGLTENEVINNIFYVEDNESTIQALSDARQLRYVLYTAYDFVDILNDYGSDEIVVGHSLIIFEGAFLSRLPTYYVNGNAKYRIFATSFYVEDDRVETEETLNDLYVDGENYINLFYRYAIKQLETITDVVDIPNRFKLEKIGNQGYQPSLSEWMISTYNKKLFNIDDLEGYNILGYINMPANNEFTHVVKIPTQSIGDYDLNINDIPDGGVRYTGLYNQRLNIRYKDLMEGEIYDTNDIKVPVFGSLESVTFSG